MNIIKYVLSLIFVLNSSLMANNFYVLTVDDAIGGVISFAVGSLILIDSPGDFMKISLELIVFSTIITIAFFGIIVWLGIKAQNRKKSHIASEMSGMKGYAIDSFKIGEKGKVHLNGEIWDAVSNQDIEKEGEIIVQKIDGFRLFVKK